MISLLGLIALILSNLAAPLGTSDYLADFDQVQPCSAPVEVDADNGSLGESTETKRISNGF